MKKGREERREGEQRRQDGREGRTLGSGAA
jgi:hypothetical protein